MNALKIVRQDRIAHHESECDHHKCHRVWGVQMRERGLILHLCNKHAADLVGARAYDKNGHAAKKFVEELNNNEVETWDAETAHLEQPFK